MSGLYSALSTSSTALNIFGKALDAEQQNVSNSATPGYGAKRVHITNTGLPGGSSTDRVSIETSSSDYADALVRLNSSDAGSAGAQTDALTPLNQLLDITGNTGVLAGFQQFSTAFSQLSVSPDDTNLRSTALQAAGQVADSFRALANGLDKQRAQVDTNVTKTVTRINTLSSQIAGLATGLRSGQDTSASLRQAIDELSTLVDVNVNTGSDGSISILAGGQALLVGDGRSFPISAVTQAATPSGGLGQITIQTATGQNVSSFSGKLGGLLQVRNNVLPGLLGGNGSNGALNDLASGFASRVNSIVTSATTFSATGAPNGSALFSFDTTNPTDVARSLQALSLTPDQLGVATVSVPGGAAGSSNGAASLLAALPSSTAAADQINGSSSQAFFAQFAAGIGQKLSSNTNSEQQFESSLTAAQASRQDQIGVSLDKEAIALTMYQRAYQASAQVISTLNTLTQTEVDILK